jgi:ribosomal protein L7/L12
MSERTPHDSQAQTNDAHLIDILGDLALDAQKRDAALRAIASLPTDFWNEERVGGAIAAIGPAAESETDEEIAFLTWNVLASLLAHVRTASDGVQFEDEITSLLGAQSAEIRGFAATSLGRTNSRDAARTLAEALVEETEFEVAIRATASLTMAGVPLPASVLIDMLEAPTEEAVAFSARTLGAAGELHARPKMIVQTRCPHEDATHLDLEDAIRALDAVEAQERSTDLFEEAAELGDGAIELLAGGGVAAGYNVQFHPKGPTVTVDFHLPVTGCEASASTLTGAIALLLCTEVTPRLEADGDRCFVVQLPLSIPAWSALRAIKTIAPILDATFEHSDRRSVAPTVVQEALKNAATAIQRIAHRPYGLQRNGHAPSRVRTRDGASWYIAGRGSAGVDDSDGPRVSWAIALDCDELLSELPASGLHLAVSWSEQTNLDLDAEACDAIARSLSWKLGIPLIGGVEDSVPPLLTAAGVPSGDIHAMWRADTTSLRDARERLTSWDSNAQFAALVQQVGSLGALFRSYAHAVRDGEDPSAALNLAPIPEPAWEAPPLPEPPEEPKVTAEFPRLSRDGSVDNPSDAAPPIPRRPPSPPVFRDDQEPTAAEDAPSHSHGPSAAAAPGAPAAMPSLPRGQTAASADQGPPLDERGRTPSEVVRELSADLTTVDVYLRSVGFNHAKLCQIMTILLGIEKAEAETIVARAPCRLLEAVPRDRARMVKTVLEGTGATIAWQDA